MTPNPLAALAACWRLAGAAALGLAALVAGCGGSVGVGGTGSYASGPIEGFGSIFVGGIRFDDSAATVVDEDGNPRSRDTFRLGMSTEVDSEAIGGPEDAPTAVATRIRTVAELVGLAGDIDTAAGTLSVFGQTVLVVDGATAFDPTFPAGLASVSDGDALEVSGVYDAAANRYVATLIAPRSGTLTTFQVRGPVQDLDTTARRFRIGAALFTYDAEHPLLDDGAYLRVRAATGPVGGRWVVNGVAVGARTLPDLDRVKLRGAVTSFVSATEFSVNGQPVDARSARRIGPPGELLLGSPVVVDGRAAGGVLIAATVRLDSRGGGSDQGSITLAGTIQSVDVAAQTFVLRDTPVFYGSNGVQFVGGSAALLTVGRAVTVRGVVTGQGSRVSARRISFD